MKINFISSLFLVIALASARELQIPFIDRDENGGSNSFWDMVGGFVTDTFCGLFGCTKNEDGNTNPFEKIVDDLTNFTDGKNPIGDAWDGAKDSETPLRDFLGELLGQPNSKRPVRDFMEEAFNRTDTPILDFLAQLFQTEKDVPPIERFVSDLINGSLSPLQDAIVGWVGDEIFADLNCTAPANTPACAYNLDGDEGVWVCRTLFNPFKRSGGDEDAQKTTHCARPGFTLKDNDVCGSCDGAYPEPCTCKCTADGITDGVLVKLNQIEGAQCVNAKWATSALNMFKVLECAAC